METIDRLKDLDAPELLTALIMGEAEAEPFVSKLAVGLTVKNRVKDKRWPDTWPAVMLQRKQFSCFLPEFFRPEIIQIHWHSLPWKECKAVAFMVLNNYVGDVTAGANHYFATWSKTPYWAKGETPVFEAGQHVFFKL